ncbi:hypothetical protein [Actinophytocola sp.]|uniref:hypothetical protein n=1 Tax=Actinophytocola sp. TaxID=1872138 RepID=UPI002ED49B5E
MNTTLPPSRDLPPGRHAQIRGAVLAATRRPNRRWIAPLVTAAAALAIVGLVAWFTPWTGNGGNAATQPTSQETTLPAPSTSTSDVSEPVAGVSPDERAAIEDGCARSGFPDETLTLKQVLTDAAGRVALLYSDRVAVVCTLDTPPTGYNPGGGGFGDFTPPVGLDTSLASAGGDVAGNKSQYAGQPGTDQFGGRVSPEVAKVTVTVGADSVDASVANGTFLARVLHPTDWLIPENRRALVLRAYDKNGTLLAEVTP